MQLTSRTLDELEVGDCAELRRLVTRDDLYVFAASSGNYNPLHLVETADGLQGTDGTVRLGTTVRRNARNATVVSMECARTTVMVVPTREELVIARAARRAARIREREREEA